MIYILLMDKDPGLGAGICLILGFQEFRGRIPAGLKDHGHSCKRRDLRLIGQRLCRLERLFIISLYQGLEDGILGRKIIIDTSLSDPGSMGDLTDRYALQFMIGQKFLKSVQDLIVFQRIWHKYHLSVMDVKTVTY